MVRLVKSIVTDWLWVNGQAATEIGVSEKENDFSHVSVVVRRASIAAEQSVLSRVMYEYGI